MNFNNHICYRKKPTVTHGAVLPPSAALSAIEHFALDLSVTQGNVSDYCNSCFFRSSKLCTVVSHTGLVVIQCNNNCRLQFKPSIISHPTYSRQIAVLDIDPGVPDVNASVGRAARNTCLAEAYGRDCLVVQVPSQVRSRPLTVCATLGKAGMLH